MRFQITRNDTPDNDIIGECAICSQTFTVADEDGDLSGHLNLKHHRVPVQIVIDNSGGSWKVGAAPRGHYELTVVDYGPSLVAIISALARGRSRQRPGDTEGG